ncbi:MAG: hypothetical protein JW798_16240 [Prolixibacteraceae bacterium]|nr:hypothetical protein [Prolixibacteraceae bacterium]
MTVRVILSLSKYDYWNFRLAEYISAGVSRRFTCRSFSEGRFSQTFLPADFADFFTWNCVPEVSIATGFRLQLGLKPHRKRESSLKYPGMNAGAIDGKAIYY